MRRMFVEPWAMMALLLPVAFMASCNASPSVVHRSDAARPQGGSLEVVQQAWSPSNLIYMGRPLESYVSRLDSAVASERMSAIGALCQVWFGYSEPTLVGLSGSGFEEYRLTQRTYTRQQDEEVTQYCVKHMALMLDDADEGVRSCAACSLALIGPKAARALPELLRAIEGTSEITASFAVRAWRSITGCIPVAACARLLASSNDEVVARVLYELSPGLEGITGLKSELERIRKDGLASSEDSRSKKAQGEAARVLQALR